MSLYICVSFWYFCISAVVCVFVVTYCLFAVCMFFFVTALSCLCMYLVSLCVCKYFSPLCGCRASVCSFAYLCSPFCTFSCLAVFICSQPNGVFVALCGSSVSLYALFCRGTRTLLGDEDSCLTPFQRFQSQQIHTDTPKQTYYIKFYSMLGKFRVNFREKKQLTFNV